MVQNARAGCTSNAVSSAGDLDASVDNPTLRQRAPGHPRPAKIDVDQAGPKLLKRMEKGALRLSKSLSAKEKFQKATDKLQGYPRALLVDDLALLGLGNHELAVAVQKYLKGNLRKPHNGTLPSSKDIQDVITTWYDNHLNEKAIALENAIYPWPQRTCC